MATEVSQLLLAVVQGIPAGATNDDLTKALPDVPAATRVEALNILLQEGGIEILKKGEKLVYRAKDPEKKSALPKDADNEEKVVYGIVEEGGNKGIWIRDIRMKSNLNMIQLNKILKNLETKKLIKAVKSVNVGSMIPYSKFNVIPNFLRAGQQKESVHAVQPRAGSLHYGRSLVPGSGL